MLLNRPLIVLIVVIVCCNVLLVLLGAAAAGTSDEQFIYIHAIPHSHCDPGWWYTFEGYYARWVRGILDAVHTCLSANENRTFIWAEISFFERWWRDQNADVRKKMREFIDSGRVEFVTGGWVMHDEGASHYTDQLLQLQVGHQWLQRTFSIVPSYAWLIDPFGHSSTTPLLYDRAGFKATVLNRIHYRLREELKRSKLFEFHWKPEWSHSSAHANHSNSTGLDNTDMFCHLLPNGYYDVPNTCGPDPDVCIEFEWEHTRGIPITPSNVAERAALLADQYRKSSKWFRSPHILIPVGDDFKYKTPEKGEKLLSQWEMVFNYINTNPERFRMQVKWSTLSRYFEELFKWEKNVRDSVIPSPEPALTSITMPPKWEVPRDSAAVFPDFRGDFLSYSDRVEQYWSGYYTSRPHLKTMIRSAHAALRALETATSAIILMLPPSAEGEGKVARNETKGSAENQKAEPLDQTALLSQLNRAIEGCMREISLLQHHDAVTGTARVEVVQDYAARLKSCMKTAGHSLSESFKAMQPLIFCPPVGQAAKSSVVNLFCSETELNWDLIQTHQLPVHGGQGDFTEPFNLPETEGFSLVLLLNTLGQDRNELVAFRGQFLDVRIHTLASGTELDVQIQPVLGDHRRTEAEANLVQPNVWQVLTRTEVPAAGWTVLLVEQRPDNSIASLPHRHFAQVLLYGSKAQSSHEFLLKTIYPSEKLKLMKTGENAKNDIDEEDQVTVQVSDLELRCDSVSGQLVSVKWTKSSEHRPVRQTLLHYRTRGSGAYIFDPQGPAEEMQVVSQGIVAVQGPLYAAVHAFLARPFRWHTISLTEGEPYVDHVTHICLDHTFGADEFAIRYKTDLKHNKTLWTDVNGWPTVSHPRVRYTDPQTGKVNTELAMAANFHPLISFASLENPDESERFTVLTRASSSAATLAEGEIEVMIDRQTHNDDGRGLGEPLMDSICFERALRLRLSDVQTAHADTSLLATRLQFPLVVASGSETLSPETQSKLTPVPQLPKNSPRSILQQPSPLPAHIHLLSMRPCLSEPTEICMQLQHTSASDRVEQIQMNQLFGSRVKPKLQCSDAGWEALPQEHSAAQPLQSCAIRPLGPLDIVHLRLIASNTSSTPSTTLATKQTSTAAKPTTTVPPTTKASATVAVTVTPPPDDEENEEEIPKHEPHIIDDDGEVAIDENAIPQIDDQQRSDDDELKDLPPLEEVHPAVLPSVSWLVLQAGVVFCVLAMLTVFVGHPRLLPRLWHRGNSNGRTEVRLDRIV